ncbi:MAG TPA: hypothetical protein VJ859_03585 [Allosphingosinicella sp.]|nr:hypothetical protein [Allosphingosinicella sp.]
MSAADLAVDHKLQFWDALIVTAAADAGCTFLLSEDMQDKFIARGLTIVDPLAADVHPRFASLLGSELRARLAQLSPITPSISPADVVREERDRR